jgi:hypothetical protein
MLVFGRRRRLDPVMPMGGIGTGTVPTVEREPDRYSGSEC